MSSKGLYDSQPPAFGHALKAYYAMDPEYINLNNGRKFSCPLVLKLKNSSLGSYGTTPKPVLQAVRDLGDKIEQNPDLFHRTLYQPMLVNVRQKIADLIKVKLDEVVLVTNASMGVNTILRNVVWEEGDIIFACGYIFHVAVHDLT